MNTEHDSEEIEKPEELKENPQEEAALCELSDSDTKAEKDAEEPAEELHGEDECGDSASQGAETPEEDAPTEVADVIGAALADEADQDGAKDKNKKTLGRRVRLALICVGALLLTFCIAAAVYFNSLLNKINYKGVDEFEQFYNLSDTDYVVQNEVYEVPLYYNESTTLEGFNFSMIDIRDEDVTNVLLLGTDLRSNSYKENGNTDSIILLSINTRDKNVKLTSFMRDMYVTIPERGQNRLNAAYSFGGPQLLFDTLKLNFDVDVDKYVRVNFSNFKKIIDAVDGIEIELTYAEADYMNEYAWKYKTKPVQSGLQRLDGAQALSYARCRKIDSDFRRTARQRKVIMAFVEEVKHKNVAELNSLLNLFLPMIQTNLSKTEIVTLMADAGSYMNNDIETLNVPINNSWKSQTIHHMSVLCPNFELNSMAIVAHIYSTYRLDVSSVVFQDFETPEADAPPISNDDESDDDAYDDDTSEAAMYSYAPYEIETDETDDP